MRTSDGNSSSCDDIAAEDNDVSSAASTSSSQRNNNNITQPQNILDHALHDPFSTHPNVVSHLKANIESYCKEAARKLFEADVLLAVTGAGFSADSGLATYDCVANIDAYQSRGWRYRDLCKPLRYTDFSSLDKEERSITKNKESQCDEMDIEQSIQVGVDEDDVFKIDKCPNYDGNKGKTNERVYVCSSSNLEEHNLLCTMSPSIHFDKPNNDLESDSEQYHFDRSVLPELNNINHPQWFYGFWGQCFNDYRRVGPHDGYDIIARWGRDKNVANIKMKQIDGIEMKEVTEEESIVAKQIRSITDKLQKEEADDDNSYGSCGNDEPYYVSDKRAGAFYFFTSNVDAHSFDVFESHEIRECHGNVELWQCHNFACGSNDSSAHRGVDESENDDVEGGNSKQMGWKRRLWRLPDNHQFVVCQETMTAPSSMKAASAQLLLSEPLPKRQKSISESDNMDDRDTANALGAIKAKTMQRHLDYSGDEDVATSSDDLLPPAHIGDVHGKPRLFPLKYMRPPNAQTSAPESYFLPMTSNWPKCPRCNEAARPAVLMFEDLDWVYNKKQEIRWQNWCQSLLKLCKLRSRGGDRDQLSFSSTSTVENGSDMSEDGWKNVDEEERVDEAESPVVDGSRVPRATTPLAFSGEDSNSIQSERRQESIDSTSLHPLRVCILEIGCGYNVPTCRAVSESLVSKLCSVGGDATLVRINPAHPEADDSAVDDNIISIMEKGLASLKLIDDEYYKLRNKET